MLKLMREHSRSWLIKSILWLVVAAFIGTIFYSWGVGRYARQQGIVAEVLNEKISYEEYREALDNLYKLYRNANKGRNADEMIDHSHLKRIALNTVIQKKLLLNEAKKMGIEISNEAIIERIRKLPAFQNEGRFDKNYYLNFLKYNQISAKDFEDSERIAILTNKIESLIRNSVKASELELREAYEWKHEKINLDYLVISPDLFKGKEELNDEKISEYFKKEKERFRIPDQIKVEFLFADPVMFKKDVKTSEQNIKNYYENHQDDFTENELVRASHILIKKLPANPDLKVDEETDGQADENFEKQKEKTKKKAEDLLSKLKEGGNFEELAKKHSEDNGNSENGGDLGYFARGGMVREFEEAAFSLNVGEISDIVETIYGYHIIKVTGKKEARTKPLSEVRDEIKEKMIDRKSKKLAKRSLLKILKSQDPIKEFEKHNDLVLIKKGTTDFFSLKDKEIPMIGISSQFKSEAFSLKENEVSRLVDTDRGYYLQRLQERKASYIPQLDEVKDEVRKSLSLREQENIAREEAHRLHQELKKGASVDDLAKQVGIQTSHTDKFDRDEAINIFSMNKALIDAAFKLKEKESTVVPVSGKYYLVYMVEKTGFDEEQYKKEKDDFLKTFLEDKQSKVLSAWLENLRKNADITINEQFL